MCGKLKPTEYITRLATAGNILTRKPTWKRVQRSAGTIDIGDDVIVPDNNRWVWALISRLGSK